jgi:hypothetical protein
MHPGNHRQTERDIPRNYSCVCFCVDQGWFSAHPKCVSMGAYVLVAKMYIKG